LATEDDNGLARSVTAAAIVLCGGRSTRMGSAKALLPFGAETMLQRVVRLLSTVASPLVVVAAPAQSLPDLPASVTVTRDEHEGRGPLEGLRAGLKALPVDAEIAYVTSCDVPLLVPAFVHRMVELLGDPRHRRMEIDGFPHPLSAVYRRRTLPRVEALLPRTGFGPCSCSTRCEPPRAAVGTPLRRSRTVDAEKSEYPAGLPGCAVDRRIR
jgi:molybdopterin-guanine dinucleotide biosynthesis protein A